LLLHDSMLKYDSHTSGTSYYMFDCGLEKETQNIFYYVSVYMDLSEMISC